mmetsp:Transcript_21944/g.48177  ORF Transcript_21944/g.48177 Transcript_21944/m.48177 type:complete len:231 (-) Transcript_21944:1121-1813(-)
MDGGEHLLGQPERRLLLRGHLLQLVHQRLQHLEAGLVGLDDHVELEAVVLAAEEALLVLVLAHLLEGVVLAAAGDVHPGVVQHVVAEGRAVRADHLRVVLRQQPVARPAPLAHGQVQLRDGPRVELLPRRDHLLHLLHVLDGELAVLATGGLAQVDVHRLAPREELVEPVDQVGAAAQNVMHQALELMLVDDFLVVDVETLEQVLISFAIPNAVLYTLEELQLLAKVGRL